LADSEKLHKGIEIIDESRVEHFEKGNLGGERAGRSVNGGVADTASFVAGKVDTEGGLNVGCYFSKQCAQGNGRGRKICTGANSRKGPRRHTIFHSREEKREAKGNGNRARENKKMVEHRSSFEKLGVGRTQQPLSPFRFWKVDTNS